MSELALGKGTSLPSARPDTRQRQHVCRVLTASTRQRMTEGPPASPEVFCRVPDTRQRGRLPSVPLCRVFGTRQRRPLSSAGFAECGTRQTASLSLCRVPVFDTRQSVKHLAKSASPVVFSLLFPSLFASTPRLSPFHVCLPPFPHVVTFIS